MVAVGAAVTCRPPHRSVRAELPHTATTLCMWRGTVLRVRMCISGLRYVDVSKASVV